MVSGPWLSCKCGNDPLGSIKGGGKYLLLIKNSELFINYNFDALGCICPKW
jgi:hypothetical protein